jgi:parallel beta-helix repeat protein
LREAINMHKNLFKNGLVIVIIILFFCMNVTLSIANDTVKKSSTLTFNSNILYVGGSGPENYSKIQDAIENSTDGVTVFVYDDSSPYFESIHINKSINLIGEDRNTTIIDADRSNPAIYIKSDTVNICEFTIQNSNKEAIEIEEGFGFCTISDNIITDNKIGIGSWCCTCNNTIEDNTFYNNEDIGIDLYHNSNNNEISGNTFEHFPGTYNWVDILIGESSGNNISYNTIKDSECGIGLWSSADNNIILNNIISSHSEYGIRISESSNNKIIGNTISYNEYFGILISTTDSKDNIIYHNNLLYNFENAADKGNNSWDDGDFGNYWSDYKDKYPDAKRIWLKGIWDTPYEIPTPYGKNGGGNKDMCPLIWKWSNSLSNIKPMDQTFIFNFNLLSWFLERFPILKNCYFSDLEYLI